MNLELTVERAKREIVADVMADRVPVSVAGYSELHDYVDANGYGGAFEDAADVEDVDFWNAMQDAVDTWIKQGGVVEGVREAEAARAESEWWPAQQL